jgi:hypothetical protein
VSVLQPEPFAAAHDGMLRHYLATGEAQLLEMAVTVLYRHASGALLPILQRTREHRAPDGHVTWEAALRPISTPNHYALLDPGLAVSATTAGARALLDAARYDGALLVHRLAGSTAAARGGGPAATSKEVLE